MPDDLLGITIPAGTTAVPTGRPGGLEEAPDDGRLYARTEARWQAVESVAGYPDFSPGGRLSFSATDPNPTPVEAVTLVHYLPAVTPIVPVFNGTGWDRRLIQAPLTNDYTDTSKNSAAMAVQACADLFVWDDDGTLRLARGQAWDYNGANRPPLEYVHQFRTNGLAIPNGPDQNRGTWVGTIATWTTDVGGNAVSYLRINSGAGGNAIWHLWNAFNKQLIVCRCSPADLINAVGGGGWNETNIKTWVVVGELSAAQITGSAVPSIMDFYMALTTSTMADQLLGEVQGTRRAMTRNRATSQHCHTSIAVMFGPGLADFGLSTCCSAMTFNALVPGLSTLYEG